MEGLEEEDWAQAVEFCSAISKIIKEQLFNSYLKLETKAR